MNTETTDGKCPVCTPACVRHPKCGEPETVIDAAFRELDRLGETLKKTQKIIDTTRAMLYQIQEQ